MSRGWVSHSCTHCAADVWRFRSKFRIVARYENGYSLEAAGEAREWMDSRECAQWGPCPFKEALLYK